MSLTRSNSINFLLKSNELPPIFSKKLKQLLALKHKTSRLNRLKNSVSTMKNEIENKTNNEIECVLNGHANNENNTIDIDMKTTHSIFLNNAERIKDYIFDFNIYICKNNNIQGEEIIGKASITAEDILNLLNSNSNNKQEVLESTVYIYGTKQVL